MITQANKMNIEYVDLSEMREGNQVLLKAARFIFGNAAYSVVAPKEGDFASKLLDYDGKVIAYCWVDEDGRPEFKPWCDYCTS